MAHFTLLIFLAATLPFVLGRPESNHMDEDHDYIVSLHKQDGGFICSGMMITPEYVLTALPCTQKATFIRAGVNSHSHGGGKYEIKGVVSDPKRSEQIALIAVHPRMKEYRAAARFLNMGLDKNKVGTQVDIVGWGRQNGEESYPDDIQKITLATIEPCPSTINGHCARGSGNNDTNCYGAPGSPVIISGGTLVAGMVAWIDEDGKNGLHKCSPTQQTRYIINTDEQPTDFIGYLLRHAEKHYTPKSG